MPQLYIYTSLSPLQVGGIATEEIKKALKNYKRAVNERAKRREQAKKAQAAKLAAARNNGTADREDHTTGMMSTNCW